MERGEGLWSRLVESMWEDEKVALYNMRAREIGSRALCECSCNRRCKHSQGSTRRKGVVNKSDNGI